MMSVLLLLGAAQGAFLSLVLSRTKKKNRAANLFLACLLLVFSVSLVHGFLSVTYLYLQYPRLIAVEWPLTFLYGPLLYFYVKSLTKPQWRIKKWKLLFHFLPAVLMYIYLIPFFRLKPELKGRLLFLVNAPARNSFPVIDPITIVAVLQITGYLLLSLRLLRAHAVNIRENFSTLDNISLSWLRTLVIICFCLLCSYAFFEIFSQFYGLYKEAEYLLYLMIAVIIYGMAYKGMRQPEIFSESQVLSEPGDGVSGNGQVNAVRDAAPSETPQEAKKEQPDKYKKSALTPEQSDAILARLTKLMQTERPYLEMGLTLPMLSNMLDISPNLLSQVINGKLNKSFFDFVNGYRVEEAKQFLVSPESDRFTILGLAMDAGFNSKSSFYGAFKKLTGMTPSQFKNKQKTRQGTTAVPSGAEASAEKVAQK